MSKARSTVTISFRKQGVKPPVFVAGTYSSPQWQLQEMRCFQDDSGENQYAAEVSVEPGNEYLYRFSQGQGGDWFVDELVRVAPDEQGSTANVLNVPSIAEVTGQPSVSLEATESQRHSSPHPGLQGFLGGASAVARHHLQSTQDVPGKSDTDRSGTPIEVVASTAAEVADTAARLDDPDFKQPDARDNRLLGHDVDGDMRPSLFAHESFGAYEFVDDGLHGDAPEGATKSPDSRLSLSDYAVDDADIDDPTLEKFPSDRFSVLTTLRRIQSGHDEHRIFLDDSQLSPREAYALSGVESLDASLASLGSLSPTSLKRRENRLSYSSFGHTRSAVSLSSIAEEPKACVENGLTQSAIVVDRKSAGDDGTRTPPTDEDEALMMRHVRV